MAVAVWSTQHTHHRTAPGRDPGGRPPGALLLAGLLLLRTAALFAGDGLAYALTGSWTTALMYADVGVVVLADVASLLVLVRRCGRERRRVRDLLGALRLRRDVPLGLGVGLLLVVATLAASFVGNLVAYGAAPPATALPAVPLWLGLWSLTLMPVTVAVSEELLYRGYLLPRLAARLGWWPAAVTVSVAFGLQHAAFSATSVPAVVARVVTTGLVGLLLAVLARRLGRLLPLVVGHWLVDVIGLGLPTLMAALAVTR